MTRGFRKIVDAIIIMTSVLAFSFSFKECIFPFNTFGKQVERMLNGFALGYPLMFSSEKLCVKYQ